MSKFLSYLIVLFVSFSVTFVTVASTLPTFKDSVKHQALPVETEEEASDCSDNCELELETEYFSADLYIFLIAPYKMAKTDFFIIHQKFDSNFVEIQKPPLV